MRKSIELGQNTVIFRTSTGEEYEGATGNPNAAGFENTYVLELANGAFKLIGTTDAYDIPDHTQDEAMRGYLDKNTSD